MANSLPLEVINQLTSKPTHFHHLVEVTGPASAKKALKDFLTVKNTSIAYQYFKAQERLRFWDGKVKGEEAVYGAASEDTRLKAAENRALVTKLSEDLVREFYHEEEDGTLLIPAGFWFLVGTKEGDHHLNTEIKLHLKSKDDLRHYQEELCTEMLKYKRATGVLATGLGKTRCIATLANSLVKAGKRVFVVVPTEYLVGQMVDTIKTYHSSITAAGGGRIPALGRDIFICTAQSALKHIEPYDAIIVDECIPYNQAVMTSEGPIEMGRLYNMWTKKQKMPLALSFNDATQKYEYRRITNFWKKKDREDLLEIKSSRLKLKATPEHKLLTTKGWKKAKDLALDDLLIGNPTTNTQRIGCPALNDTQMDIIIGSFLGDGNLDTISNKRCRLRINHGIKQKDYCLWKASFFESAVRYVSKNGYASTPAVLITTKTFDIPFELPTTKTMVPQWIADKINDRSLAIWFMDDGSVDHKTKQARLNTHSFDYNSQVILSNKLREMGIENKILTEKKKDGRSWYYLAINSSGYHRIMDIISPYIPTLDMQYKGITHKRQEWVNTTKEYSTYKIDHIKPYKYTKKRGEGYGIFDMEVESNHNFVICGGSSKEGSTGAGVVVHNCQHAPATTWVDLITAADRAEYVYNLTATAFRADGMDLGINAFGGPVVYEKTARWGIANGWLSPVEVYMKSFEFKSSFVGPNALSATAYKKMVMNEYPLLWLRDQLMKARAKGKKCIILFKTVKAAEKFKKLCKDVVKFNVAKGTFKKPLDDFCAGKTDLLVATDRLVAEGIDIPDADCLFMLTQHSSDGITYQSVGRVIRKALNKIKAVVIDISVTIDESITPDGIKPEVFRQFNNSSKKRWKTYLDITDSVTTLPTTKLH